MVRSLFLALGATFLLAGAALADPIEGNWKTEVGSTAAIAPCDAGFCITLKSGENAGKQIGAVKADGGNKYSGKITGPANDKTYTGKATLNGGSMKMSGCVFGGLICQSQTWTRM